MTATEHPNAARVRRVFAAFGKDAMAVSAAFARDIVWRVPGHTVMSGEYRGRRDVVEFLRRTGLETGGTYGAASTPSSRTTTGPSRSTARRAAATGSTSTSTRRS